MCFSPCLIMTALTLEDHIARTEQTTKIINGLGDSFALPNGWGLKELLIHIWSWDNELIHACKAKKANALEGFQFSHQKQKLDYNIWNDKIIAEKQGLSLVEVKNLFKKTRTELLSQFKSLLSVPETITDEKSFLRSENLLRIWEHDKHHLELGGLKVAF